MCWLVYLKMRWLLMSERGYTALLVGLVWGVKNCCGLGVTKVKSHSVNGKNSSLESRKESVPIC